MRHSAPHRLRLASALIVVAAGALLPLLLVPAASATPLASASPGVTAVGAPSLRDATTPLPPVVDPPATTEPVPDPEPTVPDPVDPQPPIIDPTVVPDPPATEVPTPTEAPVPTVDPVVPTEEPAPVESQAPAEESPAPSPEESDSDSSGEGESEVAPPTETPTPTPTPVPTVTATAAPAPVIELPFYPPPSAGTARDAFPFVLAGIAAGAVLILGVVAYLVSRRRLGRIRFAPAVGGRPVGTVRVGQSSEPIAGNLQLPWASTPTQAVDGAAPAAFALGFAPLETGARPSDAVAYDAAFESPPVESRSPRETTSGFFSVFARLRRGGVAATEPVSYSVFEPLTPRPVPEKQQTFGLSFGKRNPPPDAAGSFDLGLPAL